MSFLAKFIAAIALGLFVAFVIDPLDPNTISTPFCLSIILMMISLRQSVKLVVAVSLPYSIITALALISFLHYFTLHGHPSPNPYFWLFQRLGTFLVFCAMATYLAHYRTSFERDFLRLQNILGKLPAPVVISDAAGYITYANETLTTDFKLSASQLVGKRFVALLMADIEEGKAMRYYIELFGEETRDTHEIEVKPFGSSVKMNARLSCLGTGSNRVMITVLSRREQT